VSSRDIEKLVTSKDDLSKNQELDRVLTELSSMGFNVVRVSLFNNAEGLKVGKDGTISGLADGVDKNLTSLLDAAKTRKIRLYLGMADTFAGFEKNPVTDAKAQEAYLKNVVATVARKVKGNESVFALCVSGNIGATPDTEKEKGTSWEQVRTFVKAAVDSAKKQDPQRLVTAGPYDTTKLAESQVTEFGLDFYDVSADQGLAPVNGLGLNRPVLLHSLRIKDVDVKMAALKAIESGYAGFFYPTLGWKATEADGGLFDKDGKTTPIAETLSGVVKELKPGMTGSASLTNKPAAP
jgi:hypothetical protein